MRFKMSEYYNKKINMLIDSDERLKEWFNTNKNKIIYNKHIDENYSYIENNDTNQDYITLARMVTICLTWLKTKTHYSNEEKIENAIIAMNSIYENDKEFISDTAKELFYIEPKNIKQLEYKKSQTL